MHVCAYIEKKRKRGTNGASFLLVEVSVVKRERSCQRERERTQSARENDCNKKKGGNTEKITRNKKYCKEMMK